MTYTDAGGHVLRLTEDIDNPPSQRTWLFVVNTAGCDRCWHGRHAEPVQTCLACFPPQSLEFAAA